MFRSLLAIVILGLWHPVLQAHAFLQHAEPAPGSVYTAPLTEVALSFDSTLEHAFCAVRIEDSKGGVVEPVEIEHGPGYPKSLTVAVPKMKAGLYRVRWSVVSTDGHQTEGDYRFTLK